MGSATRGASIHLDLPPAPAATAAFTTPRDAPHLYPGTRPSWSYCFLGDVILPVRFGPAGLEVEDKGGARRGLDDLLLERTGSGIAHRYAVLAVGSNACPARLADPDKFAPSGEARAIPVLRGWVQGVVSVYCPRVASYGSVPSTVAGAPGARSRLWVTLLAGPELARMDRSEARGAGYELIEMPESAFVLEDGRRLAPLAAYFEPQGLRAPGSISPVALDCFEITGATSPSMGQGEVQGYVAGLTAGAEGVEVRSALLLERHGVRLLLPAGARVLKAPLAPSRRAALA